MGDTPGADDWKYDLVYLKGRDRQVVQGLVVEQNTTQVLIKCIKRRVGSPTVIITEAYPNNEVEKVVLLEPKQRDLLLKRLQALARERELLAAQLKLLDPSTKMDASAGDVLDLRKTEWILDAKTTALSYTSTHFNLVSNAREEITTLASLWLESVYAAYAHTLPPRVKSPKVTTIILMHTLADYQTFVKDQGSNFFNPALFDPEKNRIVCYCDLQRVCDQRDQVRRFNKVKRKEWDDYEAELVAAYKLRAKVPPELLKQVEEARKKITQAERDNDEGFEKAKKRLFVRLAHEAFHAYLITHVYPVEEGELPRWFNEGLAQIFETAIIEAGELRVGHADPDRLVALRHAINKDTVPDLAKLLQSGRKQFQVAHASDKQASDEYYLASWALAFHLTFEKKVLGTKGMDDYVRALKRGTDPLTAFRGLVGQPLPAFEKDYMQYLRTLRADGTVNKGT
jgi:hypothetical protein